MAENEKPTPGAEKPTPNPQGDDKPKTVTLTEDELAKQIQAETDRRITSAIKKREAELEKQWADKVAAERQDAERLARMSEEEKAKAIQAKKEDELSKREKELLHREMQIEAMKILSEKDLPATFADMVIGSTPELTLDNINNLQKMILATADKIVNDRLKGSPPPADKNQPPKQSMNDFIRAQAKRR
jgi:flagellar biosynthesis GTPase FlhF